MILFFWLGYLFAYLAACAVVAGVVWKVSKRWKAGVGVMLLGAAWPAYELVEPYWVLAPLCERDYGSHVYETVEGVEGFLLEGREDCGGACMSYLPSGLYTFLEVRATHARLGGMTPGPGLYRFTAEEYGHPQCEVFYRYEAEFLHEDYVEENMNGKCIATWPIETVQSEYAFEWIDRRVRTRGETARHVGRRIKHIESGELLFARNTYNYDPSSFWTEVFGGYGCGGGRMSEPVYAILKPLKQTP